MAPKIPAADPMTQGMTPLPGKPIGPLRLYDDQGAVEFHPLPDLTLWELMLVTQMGFWLMRPGNWHWRDYINDHKLGRHFLNINNAKEPVRLDTGLPTGFQGEVR